MDPQMSKPTSKPVSPTETPEANAQTFLAQSSHFQLGHLPTESRHPRTTRLSQLANENLPEAIALLKDVELEAMKCLLPQLPQLEQLCDDIRATLASGGRVFFCGCGATGRLSLTLETLWREEMASRGSADRIERVVSFMAGGDYAIVRSIENFEDHPEYGARQLHDLGFGEDDLMIGTTEGGETPFVIGAVEEAARVSKRAPYMLFCNPADLLARTVERSRSVIENRGIHSIALETGPMALAGSTRLQATTALMLAAGAALFAAVERPSRPRTFIDEFVNTLKAIDLSVLAPLIERESAIYKNKGICVHRTGRYAISVLTDTTERSPTFSLLPFENALDPLATPGWTYLVHSDAKDGGDAWKKTLGRAPRPLPWPGFKEKFGEAALRGFDFSPATLARRSTRSTDVHVFDIIPGAREITLRLDGLEARVPRSASLLCEHLILKIALNISSTLTMGRLGRFSGNLMLYVRAANNKLVDRAIRYVRILLDDHGVTGFTYEEVCLALYQVSQGLPVDEPAVWRTFEKLQAARAGVPPAKRSGGGTGAGSGSVPGAGHS
jgi:N-acetylmuramic acid 6-phosphate etherase